MPITTPDPVGTVGAVSLVNIETLDEKFNCLEFALYGKLAVFCGQPNHAGIALLFNAFLDIVPVVMFAA